jgi:FHA domain
LKTLLVKGPVNEIFVWVTDTSTNGTYINGEKMIKGEMRQLCPDDHVTLLKRDNGIDSRPNLGFQIIMALSKPKFDDQYKILGFLAAYLLAKKAANL